MREEPLVLAYDQREDLRADCEGHKGEDVRDLREVEQDAKEDDDDYMYQRRKHEVDVFPQEGPVLHESLRHL